MCVRAPRSLHLDRLSRSRVSWFRHSRQCHHGDRRLDGPAIGNAAQPGSVHARQAQGSGSAKTFVVAEDDGRVAGYFSLTVGQVDTLEAPERIRKGMGQYPLPVVILARLAVSIHDQGRGIGFGLLQDAIRRTMLIAEQAGIRAMLTHPIDEEAARFYTRFGFIASPLREQQLLLLLKDARRWVR